MKLSVAFIYIIIYDIIYMHYHLFTVALVMMYSAKTMTNIKKYPKKNINTGKRFLTNKFYFFPVSFLTAQEYGLVKGPLSP
jgi:hypothetical protein